MISDKDVIGKKFNKLTVLKVIRYQNPKIKVLLCKCECGVIKEIAKGNVTNGITKSCGCLKKHFRKTNHFNDYRIR